jgi:hypothetical protein
MVKITCEAPVQGIAGAYTGNSFAVQATISSLLGCALYSALELILLMYQLLVINFVIILMDVSLLVLEYLGLFITQTVLKCCFYTVKLKLEIAVLSRLGSFVRTAYEGEALG